MFDKFKFFNKINYFGYGKPHAGQLKIHQSKAKFKIAACASRWGKSTCTAAEGMFAMLNVNDSLNWVTAPTYSLAKIIFNKIAYAWETYLPELILNHKNSELHLKLKNGSELYGKSIDNPTSLLGVSVDWMGCDEAAKYPPNIWHEFLLPRTIEKKAEVFFPSTPKGAQGWFHELYALGKGVDPNYFSVDGPIWDNPAIDKAYVESLKPRWTEEYYRQEILGQFIDKAGIVFKNVDNYIKGELERFSKDKRYVIGVDLARQVDWTVIIVMDNNGHVVYFDRFNKIEWSAQKQRICEVSKLYEHPLIYMDSSGIGDPIVSDLRTIGLNIMPVKTAQEKTNLIDCLRIAMDNGKLSYPKIDILTDELKLFGYTQDKSGRISYNAPFGLHDDCVISLSLAWRGAEGLNGSEMDNVVLGWEAPEKRKLSLAMGRRI